MKMFASEEMHQTNDKKSMATLWVTASAELYGWAGARRETRRVWRGAER